MAFSDCPCDPPTNAYAVTPSNSTNDPNGPFLWLYIASAGDVKITTLNNIDVVFPACPAGFILWVQTKRVWSTGTTVSNPSTNIVGTK